MTEIIRTSILARRRRECKKDDYDEEWPQDGKRPDDGKWSHGGKRLPDICKTLLEMWNHLSRRKNLFHKCGKFPQGVKIFYDGKCKIVSECEWLNTEKIVRSI